MSEPTWHEIRQLQGRVKRLEAELAEAKRQNALLTETLSTLADAPANAAERVS